MKLTSSTPTAKHDRWKNDDFMLKNQVMICGDYQIELLIPFLIMRAVVVGEVRFSILMLTGEKPINLINSWSFSVPVVAFILHIRACC